ncbi:MAG: hypothetical protein LBV72_11635 [Tannerella sp.]|jgi:hypothetical protein|nr:hypothetical protein [Tannerella sp.]
MWVILLVLLYLPFIIFILSEYKGYEKSERQKRKEVEKFNQRFEPYTPILEKHFQSIDFLVEEAKPVFNYFYENRIRQDIWDETLNESLIYHCMYWTNQQYCFLDHKNDKKEISRRSSELTSYFKTTYTYYAKRKLNNEEESLLFKIDKSRAGKVPYFYLLTNNTEKYYHEICHFADLNTDINIQHVRTLYYRGHCHLACQQQTPKTTSYTLKLYLHYLSVKSKSDTYSKYRFYFGNQAEVQAFNNICEQLKQDADLDNAFAQLDVFMHTTFPDDLKPEPLPPPRKKIKLNISSIQDAKVKQKEVAELLGEYLNEEDIENGTSSTLPSAHITPDNTDSNQEELFNLFRSNAFRLSMENVNEFAQSKGLFTESFIESINEQYYETLDDLLIEEDEDCFTLNREYIEQIMNK